MLGYPPTPLALGTPLADRPTHLPPHPSPPPPPRNDCTQRVLHRALLLLVLDTFCENFSKLRHINV